MCLMGSKEEMHRDRAGVRGTLRACKQDLAVERHGSTGREQTNLFEFPSEQEINIMSFGSTVEQPDQSVIENTYIWVGRLLPCYTEHLYCGYGSKPTKLCRRISRELYHLITRGNACK